uniref:Uncharacterized protein n=1 Tax=Glossina brevipalpis TaxID=37001 RepID=A0A1A9X178_9MUSC
MYGMRNNNNTRMTNERSFLKALGGVCSAPVAVINREDKPPRKKTRLADTTVKTLETTTVSEDDTDNIKKLSENLAGKHVSLLKDTSANNSKLSNQENDELLEKTKEDIAHS